MIERWIIGDVPKARVMEKKCSSVKDSVCVMHPENKVRKTMFSRRIKKSNKRKL